MTKITKKIIYLIIFLMSALILLSACENQNAAIPDDVDIDLINKVSARFDEIFLAYNEQRFEDYLSYYKIDDEQKNLLLESLKANVELFTSKYEIRNVMAFTGDDGVISATILYYAISTDSDNKSTIVEETMYYKLTEENGNLFIASYESGPVTLVE